VIYVTRLDGSTLVVNADLIETVEHTADTVITLLDGKKLVVRTLVDDVVERVIGYRQMIARGPLRIADDTPPLGAAAAAVHDQQQRHEPTPFRPREAH
jgi:flagellar protein FlbD